MAKKYTPPHIKKSKQGSLHKALGVKKSDKIPASKLKIKSTDSPAMKKKKQFAINAKKWKHQTGGDLDEAGQLLDQYNDQNDITSGVGAPGNFQPVQPNAGASAQQRGLIDPGQQPYNMSPESTNSSVDLQQYLKTPKGQQAAKRYKRMGYDITGIDSNGQPSFSKATKVVTGPNKGVELFNGAASLATGIADVFHEKDQRADEYRNVVKNIAPQFMENMESEGLNNMPAYTMYGGRKKMGGPISYGEPVGVVDFDSGPGLDDAMYEGIRHSGPYGQSMIYSGNLGKYTTGGHVSAAKAKEILRDGTAQGHPLTDKQKKYFAWLAGGGKQTGGVVNAFKPGVLPRQVTKQITDDRGLTSVQFQEGDKQSGYDFMTPAEYQQRLGASVYPPGGNPVQGVPKYNFENGVVSSAQDSVNYARVYNDAINNANGQQPFVNLNGIIPATSADNARLDAQQFINQTMKKKKQSGGFVPRHQAGGQPAGPNPNPVNPPADQTDPNDEYYKANATLQYFKTQLNNKLRDKDPKAYDQYQSGFSDIQNQYKSGKLSPTQIIPARQQYVQNSEYNVALSPEDVQGALGDQYQNYLNSLQTINKYNVQKGQQPLYGDIEGDQDVTKLNYGRRFAAVTTNPNSSVTTKNAQGRPVKTVNRNYIYDPNAHKVNSSESVQQYDDQGNPIQQGQLGSRQAGGYAVGQEVHLTTAQIKALKKQGYKIENV